MQRFVARSRRCSKHEGSGQHSKPGLSACRRTAKRAGLPPCGGSPDAAALDNIVVEGDVDRPKKERTSRALSAITASAMTTISSRSVSIDEHAIVVAFHEELAGLASAQVASRERVCVVKEELMGRALVCADSVSCL